MLALVTAVQFADADVSFFAIWQTSEYSKAVLTVSPPPPLPVDLQVKSLVFDQSGTYLAVGGSDIRVYICKQWSEVLNFTGECSFVFFFFYTKYKCY